MWENKLTTVSQFIRFCANSFCIYCPTRWQDNVILYILCHCWMNEVYISERFMEIGSVFKITGAHKHTKTHTFDQNYDIKRVLKIFQLNPHSKFHFQWSQDYYNCVKIVKMDVSIYEMIFLLLKIAIKRRNTDLHNLFHSAWIKFSPLFIISKFTFV